MCHYDLGSAAPFPDLRMEITWACFHTVSVENRVTNVDEEGYSSLGKMPQNSVQNTIRARSPVDLETHDGFVNFLRICYIGVR